MTKIVSGIESITGESRGKITERRWHMYKWYTSDKASSHVAISPIFKSGVTVHKIYIEFFNLNAAEEGGIWVSFCVTNDENLPWANTLTETQIIEFRSNIVENRWVAEYRKHQLELDVTRQYLGSNLRLAIGYKSMTESDIECMAGILYSEP